MKPDPVNPWTTNESEMPAATMRYHFAMAAITGILSNPNRSTCPAQAAIDAWQYADAMLKARDKAEEEA